MTVTKYELRRGTYYDSVVLMQLQRGLLGLPGVLDAGVAMATRANCDLLAANHLLPDSMAANPDDLLIVVKTEADASATNAINQIDSLLAVRRTSTAHDYRPRSLSAAAKLLPEAHWVLISVPGRYAADVARDALGLNKHVFLYSDNVSLEDEIALKQTAREKGLLVMGPDCGTAIVNGIGMGFANHVRRGPIGLVGASGTGLQAVTTYIHNLGAGVSHVIGTGGRDLKSEVGAITAQQALHLLAQDAETRVIVLISKPPSADVVTGLINLARDMNKPVVIYFLGYPAPSIDLGNVFFATSLSDAAELAVGLLEKDIDFRADKRNPHTERFVRGLFSGGTLGYETLLALQATLSPLYPNAPITGHQFLNDPLHSKAHTIIDLGDEFFMVGRLHPMIDNDLRIRRFRQEAADPDTGIILLDVVLGEGSHPNPASELAPVIHEAKRARPELDVVVIMVGTKDDPQDLSSQMDQLTKAGAVLFSTVGDAVNYINRSVTHATEYANPAVDIESFNRPFAAINVGLESFYESLVSQGAQAIHVEWRPPAGGNEKLASLLARMKK